MGRDDRAPMRYKQKVIYLSNMHNEHSTEWEDLSGTVDWTDKDYVELTNSGIIRSNRRYQFCTLTYNAYSTNWSLVTHGFVEDTNPPLLFDNDILAYLGNFRTTKHDTTAQTTAITLTNSTWYHFEWTWTPYYVILQIYTLGNVLVFSAIHRNATNYPLYLFFAGGNSTFRIGGLTVYTTQNEQKLEIEYNAIEPTTGSNKALEYEHAEVHSGDHFFWYEYHDIAGSATYDILIVTPNTTEWAHMKIAIEVERESIITLYEGTTTSNDGTAQTEFNNNRNSTHTNTTQIFRAPTITAVGTQIAQGAYGSSRQFGGVATNAQEFVLKQNTKYLLRVVNNTANASLTSYGITWYEHTNRSVIT